ncbi:tyrosinase family protein [Chitinophaga polysaccharea]|uniref:tyrosinase family protein n=1 Tax=Chitinophaga polysaccharea TaxID=1293035 RepID=UPI0014555DAF|nr:tyrosinase family protein [Chitinophaga polysaccharea]NLR62486.1 tyrosinase family protein [Chitinophaga polysaccharea]
MTRNGIGVRRSIIEIQNDYDAGTNNDLEKLMTAWAYIKALPPTDPNSFFVIGGYHGEPFAGEGATNPEWWGGYCNHQNVLFPTWHRVYVYKLEKALQTTPGCEDVMQPYWDETDSYSTTYGIPRALTAPKFTFKGAFPQCLRDKGIVPDDNNAIDNPLASFTFPKKITDLVNNDDSVYSKPQGYQTVRYPLSGLVGTPQAQATTYEYNANFFDPNANIALLNANVLQWLNNVTYYIPGCGPGDGTTRPAGIAKAFSDCLDAPNYTIFSNTQSAAYYGKGYTALEHPHNDIHLAVGGFNLPKGINNGGYDLSQLPDANGDMGENDTAGLDPIFFFHHCNIDRVFWLWQQKQGFTERFDIIEDPADLGTSNGFNDGAGQGPANGQTENETLTMTTALKPFIKTDTTYFTSEDCINIESQLNYTYSDGSLSENDVVAAARAAKVVDSKRSDLHLYISGLSRGGIKGSFIVGVYATKGDDTRYLVGYQSVLSRWDVGGCANCQAHLGISGAVSLNQYTEEEVSGMKFHLEIFGREKQNTERFKQFRTLVALDTPPYKLEVR